MRVLRAFLRFFFHHFYHDFSWTYDAVAALVSMGRWNQWILCALPYIRGQQVLELGFGNGHLQLALAKSGYKAFGLDESRQMAKQTFLRLTRNALPPKLSRGYAQSLPFEAACFDTLVATFPTEYILEAQTLEEVHRVLRPGGRLVVIPTAWIGGQAPSDRAAAWFFRVTHQAERITDDLQDRIKVPFAAAGFGVETVVVTVRSSSVLIILARKAETK